MCAVDMDVLVPKQKPLMYSFDGWCECYIDGAVVVVAILLLAAITFAFNANQL